MVFLNVTTFNQGSFSHDKFHLFFLYSIFAFSLLLLAPLTKILRIFRITKIAESKRSVPYSNTGRFPDRRLWSNGVRGLPALLENKLNQEISPKTKINYEIINGGLTGSTSSGGVSRIWFLKGNPDHLILALGGNDGLRGIPEEPKKTNPNHSKSTGQKNSGSIGRHEDSTKLRP